QVEVRIVDMVTGQTQPIGTPGEFCVRGYQNMHGYCGREEESGAAIDQGGWLHMGDIGTMDERGYLRVTGRLKDMIIRGGLNIYPREIEELLFTHPAVAEAAVIGVPDERWGEQILAVVELRGEAPAITADELYQFCRDRMSSHKAPTQWVFIDRLPMTPTGKVQKFMLREQLASGELSERLVLTKSTSGTKTSEE